MGARDHFQLEQLGHIMTKLVNRYDICHLTLALR
jgi:hypothetical protein